MTNEVRPDVKGGKKGTANNELWTKFESELGTTLKELIWASVNIEKTKNADGKDEYKFKATEHNQYLTAEELDKLDDKAREEYNSNTTTFTSAKELTDAHENTLSILHGIIDALEERGKEIYLDLIKSDKNYATRMQVIDHFKCEIRSTQKKSDKNYVGHEQVNGRFFFKYKVDSDEMSINKMRTIWDNSEEMAKYYADIVKAEDERKKAEEAKKKAEEERKRNEQMLADAQKQNAELMKQMQEMMQRMAALEAAQAK